VASGLGLKQPLSPLAWRDYVEEDQEEKGQDASLKGQPR
jgi:hypothetical protein